MELISIIVPIYKVEKELCRCIDSIIAQTYRELEIILVDDGSPDSCPEICDDYAKKDNRVKVIHKKNGGLSDARNAGIDIARGEYLFFVDSDDFVHKRIIERLYDALVTQKADISMCEFLRFSEKDRIIDKNLDNVPDVHSLSSEKALYSLYEGDSSVYVVAWAKLYKKSLFDGVRYKKGKTNEDNFTTYLLFDKASSLAYLCEKLYYYYVRTDSIMGVAFNEKRLDCIEAFSLQCDYYKVTSREDLYRRAAYTKLEILSSFISLAGDEKLKARIISMRDDWAESIKDIIDYDTCPVYFNQTKPFLYKLHRLAVKLKQR